MPYADPQDKRDYQSKYQSSEKEKKKRAARNAARRELEKEGLVHKGDNKDVDHKKMLKDGGSNARSNLRAVSRHENRGWRKK